MNLTEFFRAVFPDGEGWTPIILKGPMGGLTNFHWFNLPAQLDKMVAYTKAHADLDVYYSPFLYTKPRPCRTPATRPRIMSSALRACGQMVMTALSTS